MGIHYGIKGRRIQSYDVNAITIANCSIASQLDTNDGYEITFNNAGSGCTLNVSFYIELKDLYPWSNISCEFYLTGTASCWAFNQSGQGAVTGNLLTYNSTIDIISKAKNCFELPQFTKQMSVCDNASTNMMHDSYDVGSYRQFRINRRRDVNGGLAGISHGRNCIGGNGTTTVKNIYVW